MRYLVSICVGLLALVLILQIGILGRLNEIAKGRAQSITYVPGTSVSASQIAAEIRRQTALEGPPSFDFQFSNSGGSSRDGLILAVFRMKRRAGPAKEISVQAGDGVNVETKKQPSDLRDCDEYLISFTPKAGGLPMSWTFSVSYTDRDDKAQERAFEVTYAPNKIPPAHLHIAEKHG